MTDFQPTFQIFKVHDLKVDEIKNELSDDDKNPVDKTSELIFSLFFTSLKSPLVVKIRVLNRQKRILMCAKKFQRS